MKYVYIYIYITVYFYSDALNYDMIISYDNNCAANQHIRMI